MVVYHTSGYLHYTDRLIIAIFNMQVSAYVGYLMLVRCPAIFCQVWLLPWSMPSCNPDKLNTHIACLS